MREALILISYFSTILVCCAQNSKTNLFIEQANAYHNAQKHELALNALDSAIVLSPNDPELYYLKGTYLGCRTKLSCKVALELFNKAIQLDPEYSKAYFEKYLIFRFNKLELEGSWISLNPNENNFLSAVKNIELAIKNDHNNPYYYEAKSGLFVAIETVENWREYYEMALESLIKAVFYERDHKNLARYYFQMVDIYYEFDDSFNAVIALSSAIKNDSSRSKYFYWRGYHKHKLTNLKGAVSDFTKAIQLGGLNYTYLTYEKRGFCKYDLNDFIGAKEDFTIAINNRYRLINEHNYEPMFPKLYDLYLNRGFSNYYLKKLNEACSDYNKASELGSKKAYEFIKKDCN